MGENAIILGQNSFLYSLHTTQYFSRFVKHVVAALQIQPSRRGYLEETLRDCHGAYPVPGVICHSVSQSREPAHGTVPRKEGFFFFFFLNTSCVTILIYFMKQYFVAALQEWIYFPPPPNFK